MKEQRRYFSYLLRLWETSDGDETIWRASLECPGSGQRRGFGNLTDLISFLEAQTKEQAVRDQGSDPPDGT